MKRHSCVWLKSFFQYISILKIATSSLLAAFSIRFRESTFLSAPSLQSQLQLQLTMRVNSFFLPGSLDGRSRGGRRLSMENMELMKLNADKNMVRRQTHKRYTKSDE